MAMVPSTSGDLPMSGFFYQLGKKAGPMFRQGNWLLQSLTGTEADAIAAEYTVGRDLAAEVRASWPPEALAVDPDRVAWLDRIVADLAARLTNKLRRFRVALVATGEPNAFALPGGFIFVERSLLELCEWNRDDAAFVVGHEFGHVVEGHAMQRIASDRILAGALGRLPIGGAPGMLLRQAAGLFLTSAYSRDQEFAADRFGARLTAAAGYDPAAGARLFARLAARSAGDDVPLARYFASHPPLPDRIAALGRMLGAALPPPGSNSR